MIRIHEIMELVSKLNEICICLSYARFVALWVPLEFDLVPHVVVLWMKYSGPARRAVTNQVGFKSR